jgi:hypothetical protein
MAKLVKRLKNGKYAVNKEAVIAKLVKSRKALKAVDVSLIEVPVTDIAEVHGDMTRYSADNLLNHNEE